MLSGLRVEEISETQYQITQIMTTAFPDISIFSQVFKNNLKNIPYKLFPLLLALWKKEETWETDLKSRAYTRCVCMGRNSEALGKQNPKTKSS